MLPFERVESRDHSDTPLFAFHRKLRRQKIEMFLSRNVRFWELRVGMSRDVDSMNAHTDF